MEALTFSEQRTETAPADLTDVQVDGLIALDAEAWREFFALYFRRLYRFAYVRTSDGPLAEEIAAETFAAAAKAIGRFRKTGAPIGAWLYRIARNITADRLDGRRRRPETPLGEVDPEAVSGWTMQIEARADIDSCLARLTREQQEVIALRFFNDCSVVEVAAAMGKSEGAVKLLQHRALAALRKQMTREEHGR